MVFFAGEKELLEGIKGALERRHSKYRELIANSNFEIIVKFVIKVRDSAENALEIITNLSYYLSSIELK